MIYIYTPDALDIGDRILEVDGVEANDESIVDIYTYVQYTLLMYE